VVTARQDFGQHPNHRFAGLATDRVLNQRLGITIQVSTIFGYFVLTAKRADHGAL